MAVIAPKPFYHPARYLPRFHWELLACGARGHVLVGTDVREVTEQDSVIVREIDGVRWHRCLRCDAWVPLAPPAAPERDRVPAHAEIVLRLIAIDRFIHFIVLAALAGAGLVFANDQAHLRRLYDTALRAIEGVN